MLDNGTITATNTRIDTLASDLDTAESDISTLQSTINDATTGLAATKAIADAAATTANAAATQSDLTSLTTRVSTLESKVETVVIDKPQSGSNYTNDEPNISSPSNLVNYLIQDDEGRYYYWRYINNNWELISGAGEGGGTGTSSGVIVSTLPTAQDADENTDYFVGTNETGYLHYRFTTIDNELTAVLIGVHPDNIKRYNMEKITSNDKSYLRLYEFNYGENNVITDDTNVANWIESTAYTVEDQVIYNGYLYQCTTANNDAEWTDAHWERISDMRIVTTIELPQGGGSGSTTGAVTRFIRLAPTSITTI